MALYRVLIIPMGADKDYRDADGRGIGDDWLLADLGYDESLNAKLYVTTDRIRASEAHDFSPEPHEIAALLMKALTDFAQTRKQFEATR